jgi:hypothetical protein
VTLDARDLWVAIQRLVAQSHELKAFLIAAHGSVDNRSPVSDDTITEQHSSSIWLLNMLSYINEETQAKGISES